MNELILKKTTKPVQNKMHNNGGLKEEKRFNTISVPKEDMIMPNEFNSVSDPVHTQSLSEGFFRVY